MNPSSITEMLARLPTEMIAERLHIYQELRSKSEQDVMVQSMLDKELERRSAMHV